jgi:hypothetical protein
MIKIIDDIISLNEQEKIKQTLFENTSFPWYYRKDVSYTESPHTQSRPGFSHQFVFNGKPSAFHTLTHNIIENAALEINLKEVTVIQARSFLQLPLDENFTGRDIDTPHIDLREPHWVFLYYVTDSDGDTIIFENEFKENEEPPFFEQLRGYATITPKQGRLVIFDGKQWHTAVQPRKNVRCIINIDIKKG